MLDTGFAEGLHASGFTHRASARAGGAIVYRLSDGSGHVLVPAREWDTLRRDHGDALRPVRRRTRWTSLALLPAILLFGMTLGQVLPFAGPIILGAMFGGPILIYLRHSRATQRFAVEREQRLADYPRCEAPRRDPRRLPRWVDLAILLLVGPELLLSIIGQVGGPDAFRGTTLWGTGIGVADVSALALLALRWSWPRLVRQASVH